MLTQHELKQILRYDPDTGLFYRLTDQGHPVGTRRRDGYVVIKVDKLRRAHRLAFLYMSGECPGIVDHINGDRADNRWCNLRASDKSLNAQNQTHAKVHNGAGLLGAVCARNKFAARIKIDGVTHHLGTFGTPEEAHSAYVVAKRKLHPASTL